MTIRLLPVLMFASLAACSRQQAAPPAAPEPAPAPTAAAAPASTPAIITYRCGNGRTLDAAYKGDKAIIVWGGKQYELRVAESASGARYVGDGLQWWTKGVREATLSKLRLGEFTASEVGITCTTDQVLPPATPPPPKR